MSIDQEKMIVEALSSLYPLKEFEEKAIHKVIDALSTAEPKRGKWIRTGSGSLYDHYECSECGKAPKWECMGDNRWKIAFTDFCPNCGCRMDGGE